MPPLGDHRARLDPPGCRHWLLQGIPASFPSSSGSALGFSGSREPHLCPGSVQSPRSLRAPPCPACRVQLSSSEPGQSFPLCTENPAGSGGGSCGSGLSGGPGKDRAQASIWPRVGRCHAALKPPRASAAPKPRRFSGRMWDGELLFVLREAGNQLGGPRG